MPKIDISKAAVRTQGVYPGELGKVTHGREKTVLGNVARLTQFGVNLTRLKPGAASALRHWHETEDEFVYILEGEVTLVENGGESVLKAGEAAGFRANDPNAHCLINKSQRDVLYLEVGTRSPRDRYHYPDVDLEGEKNENGVRFWSKSGEILLMPKIDIPKAEIDRNTRYPGALADPLQGREKCKLGDAIGLTQFGVNIATLPPGVWSSQRHWHANEDEFIYVLEGEIVLVEDSGEVVLKAGDAAGFKANSGNGHCLINRTAKTARYIEVGTRAAKDKVTYSDVDMMLERDGANRRYLRKSGEPY